MSERAGADTIADHRVHLATVPLRLLKEAPQTLVALPAAFAFISDVGWASVLLFALGVTIVVIALYSLAWRRFRYGVGAGDLVIESGLLNRTRRSIPFERVQDVDIERGPLHRLFGLAKVRIETGGGASDEGLLDSVALAEAERLRGAIRAGRARVAEQVEATAEEPEERLIFAMALPRVLVSGLFNFSLIWIAGIFGALQTFKDLLPFDIYDPGRWVGLVGDRFGGRFTTGPILAVLLLALLLGVISGVLRTLARDYGFRLTGQGERFRRERGLATRTEVVLPKRRVQLARVETGPLRRALGWFGLFFQTLSAGKDGGGHQSVAPLAREGEMAVILAEQGTLHLPHPPELEMVSSRHLLRTLLANAAVPLTAILIVSIGWRPALFLLALMPLLLGVALLERRFHRYGLVGDLLFVRRGVWRQQLWILPIAKAQTVRLSRSFLQRKLGLASLLVDTAGAPIMNPPRIVDLREAKARTLAAAIAERLRHAGYDSGRKSGTDK